MTEDEVLDLLATKSLPPLAGQRVSAEISSHLSRLTDLENTLIARFKSSEMSQSEITRAQQQIWQLIDSTKNDTAENARCRLVVGIVSLAANFDEQYAEMIYHWAKIVGIADEVVTVAIQSEIARW
jgi:hypothetical protein